MTDESDTAEIDLMDAVRDVKGAKITLLVAVALAVVVAVLVANFAPKSYIARAELVPAESNSQGSGNPALSQLSGAASLLGVNLGPADDSTFIEYKELLNSQRLAAVLYRDDALKAIIFPGAWDAEKHQWNEPSGIGAAVHWVVDGVMGKPAWSPPGPFEVQNYLDSNLDILTDKVTGFFKLSIEEDSPEKAAALLNAIVSAADNLMRQSVKSRATARIGYLTRVLQSTTQEDQRNTIINLLSAQEKVLMLASVDPTYAVDVIDPPAVDLRPASPSFSHVLALGIALAILFVSLWSVLRGFFFVRGGRSGIDPSLDLALLQWGRRIAGKMPGRKNPHPAQP